MHRAALILLFFFASSHLAHSETWERFRGPNGLGVAINQKLPAQLDVKAHLLWKVAIPGAGNSSPVVWNDRLFLQSASRTGDQRMLFGLNAANGQVLWERKSTGVAAAYNKKNTLASSTPATDGAAVYTSTWDGKSITLSAESMTGAPLWEKKLGDFKSEHGAGASPMVYLDKVYYTFDQDGKSTLFAFDKRTGAQVWAQPREGYRACYTTPHIHISDVNGTELLVASTAGITSYEPDTGKVIWDWSWDWKTRGGQPLRTIAELVLVGDRVVATAGTQSARLTVGLQLSPEPRKAPKQVWINKKDFPYVTSPVAYNGLLYFANDRGFAGCFDPKTGDAAYLERIDNATFNASPIIVDGKVYACSEQGDIFVYAAEPTFKLLGSTSLGEVIRATPAVADGRIYIRGAEHLYCFGRKN